MPSMLVNKKNSVKKSAESERERERDKRVQLLTYTCTKFCLITNIEM